MPWYIPFLIFAARVCDVSIGTIRTILIVSGMRLLPAMLGFCEVVIWTFAISFALKWLDYPAALIGYAGGFATGVFVGSTIERRIALGFRVVRIISTNLTANVPYKLREQGFVVTKLDGHGKSGPVEIALLVIRRRELGRLIRLVEDADPDAFVTVERGERPHGGAFAAEGRAGLRPWFNLGMLRK